MGVFKDVIIEIINRFDKKSLESASRSDKDFFIALIFERYNIQLDEVDLLMVVDKYGYSEPIKGNIRSTPISQTKTDRGLLSKRESVKNKK